MLQSPRHPVPPLLGSQKRRGTPLHRTTARREPRAGPAWLPGPSAQRSQPIAPPASVCVLLATAEPKAVQRGSRGSACDRGGKINIEIPARLTRLLQRELQPENNSTYSVLACLPSSYVFLFTNDSKKLNVHVTLNKMRAYIVHRSLHWVHQFKVTCTLSFPESLVKRKNIRRE